MLVPYNAFKGPFSYNAFKGPFSYNAFKGHFTLDHQKSDCVEKKVNSLHNDKIQDWSKLKAPAANKINATEKSKFVSQRVENMVRKGENAGYQHFLLFPQCFQKASLSG